MLYFIELFIFYHENISCTSLGQKKYIHIHFVFLYTYILWNKIVLTECYSFLKRKQCSTPYSPCVASFLFHFDLYSFILIRFPSFSLRDLGRHNTYLNSIFYAFAKAWPQSQFNVCSCLELLFTGYSCA